MVTNQSQPTFHNQSIPYRIDYRTRRNTFRRFHIEHQNLSRFISHNQHLVTQKHHFCDSDIRDKQPLTNTTWNLHLTPTLFPPPSSESAPSRLH